MKKGLKIVLIIIIILLLATFVGIILKNTVFSPWIKNSNYLYESAKDAIIAEEKSTSPDRTVSGFHTFVSMKEFGIQKGEEPSEKYVYVWIYYQSYYIENDQLWKSTGGSHPYKFIFNNDEFVRYEIPDNTHNYINEIRDLFPDKIEDTIINFNSPDNIKSLTDDVRSQVDSFEEYKEITHKGN